MLVSILDDWTLLSKVSRDNGDGLLLKSAVICSVLHIFCSSYQIVLDAFIDSVSLYTRKQFPPAYTRDIKYMEALRFAAFSMHCFI